MKKFLKVLGIIVLVIVILFVALFIYEFVKVSKQDKPEETKVEETVATPEPEEEAEEVEEAAEEAAKEAEEENKLTVEDIVAIYKLSLGQNFNDDGQGYEVKQDGDIIQINVWGEGVSEGAVLAKANSEAKASWDGMVENFKSSSKSFQSVLDENGHSDVTAMVNVVNDKNHDRIILIVSNGVVLYDAVNDINLLS